MRSTDPWVGCELELMAIETLVAVTQSCNDRGDLRQLVQHPVNIHIARMHHEINSAKHLEDAWRQMLAGFWNMGIRNKADSHLFSPRDRGFRVGDNPNYHGLGARAIFAP